MDAKQRPFASIDAMRHQVARVLDHQSFSRSRGPARLLKHLADRLAFNGGLPVTQTELAKVLGLPRDFDPSRNPLVRMHMSKLRRMLSRYAAGDGRNDEVVLELPRNSYQLRAYASPTPAAAVGEGSLNGNVAAAASSRSLVLVSEFVSPAEPTLGAALARSLASLLVAELLNLLGQLPVEVVALTLCGLGLLVSDIAQNLGTHWAVRWEHFLDGAGGKIHTRFGHDGVDNFAGTKEVSTTGGIIAQARALETFLVLLVPLLACFLVLLNHSNGF